MHVGMDVVWPVSSTHREKLSLEPLLYKLHVLARLDSQSKHPSHASKMASEELPW